MNRVIKFRGKRLDNGEWCYGYYTYVHDTHTIHWENEDGAPWWADVDPKTIGQFSGLCDMHDQEIYEGDIVEACFKYETLGPNGGVIPDQDCIVHGIVEWVDFGLCIKITDCEYPLKKEFNNGDLEYLTFSAFELPEEDIEVIGNIHDNNQ